MSFLSRSDDSDSSGSSSSFHGHGRDRRTSTADTHDTRHEDTPGSPLRKKLRRSDYNAFASLVNGLKHTRPIKPLNERLLARSVTPSRTTPAAGLAGRADSPLVELSPESRTVGNKSRLLFDVQSRVDELLDDRWPLYAKQLGPGPDFAENVGTVASKMVRIRRMTNPYIRNRALVTEEALDEGDDVIAPLPEDLVESTRMYLDKLLAGLAILRPSMTRPQRERLAPTGWQAVLETAGLVKHGSRWVEAAPCPVAGANGSVARSANERISKLFGREESGEGAARGQSNVLRASAAGIRCRRLMAEVQQRLDMITSQRVERRPLEADDDAVLAAVLKPKRLTKTQIQAKEVQDRVESRREKKAAKLAQVMEKRAMKEAKALKQDEAYQQQIADEKEQVEIKMRIARADRKRKREAERAQKEDRKRLRAERRERKRIRAEARAERARSKTPGASRTGREGNGGVTHGTGHGSGRQNVADMALGSADSGSRGDTTHRADPTTTPEGSSGQATRRKPTQRAKRVAQPQGSGAIVDPRARDDDGAGTGPSLDSTILHSTNSRTTGRGRSKR